MVCAVEVGGQGERDCVRHGCSAAGRAAAVGRPLEVGSGLAAAGDQQLL